MQKINIKKTLIIGYILILVFILPGFANLLQNNDFEIWTDVSQPANWTVEDTNYARVYKESTIVFHGTYAAKLVRLVSGFGLNKGLLQRVPVSGRGRYIARAQFYDNNDSVVGGLTIVWRRADLTYINSWTTIYTVNSSIWQVVERSAVTDTAPVGAAFADFLLRTYGLTSSPAGGTMVVDYAFFDQFTADTTVMVCYPNGGEILAGGSNQIIKWRTTFTGFARFRLLLSRDSGSTYSDTIVHNVAPAESTYLWLTPIINISTCRVKVQVLDTSANVVCEDVSNGNFTIRTLATVVSPNGGETWLGGTNQTIKWRTTGAGFARYRILFSQNSGSSYLDTIAHNIPPTESSYLWLTPSINNTTCRVKVQILDALGNLISEDASDENFAIQPIIVVSPNGGEVWSGGSNQIVKWRTSSTGFARFRLLLSRNGGSTYTDTISHNVALTESTYLWLTPTINVTTCRIKIQALDALGNVMCEDEGDENFTIQTVVIVTLATPNGGEFWAGGSNQFIRWRATPTGLGRFRLILSRNSGATYTDTIASNIASTESTYLWLTPTINNSTCRVKVQILDTLSNLISEDASNSNFTIDSDPPSSFSLALPLNNGWTNASPRFVWHRATDNFAISYYQLSIAIPNETLLINTQDSINPMPPPGSTWQQATASAGWSCRQYHTSVVFDNKIWVIGGYDGSCRNDAWYSTNGIIWLCATNSAQWSPRCGHTSVVFDNKIWVIGGYDDNNRNDVWYSSDGVNWTCATPSAQWQGKSAHTSIVFDNKIWVLGGSNRNDVWYSSDGVNWTCATQSAGWSSRDNHTSLTFDNKMWVLGGSNRRDVWYSTDGINWTCATTSAWYGWKYGHTSVVFDNKMWVIGGGYPGSDVWYSSNGVDWTEATSYAEWTARLNHTSVVFRSMMWVLGGFDRDYNIRRNDVWHSVSPPRLPEGTQTWWVTAFDRAGNSRRSNETFAVRVDTTPPSIPILISPANGIILTNSTVTFIWHSSFDILSGFRYYRFQVANNLNFINPTITSVTDTFITATLTDTTYFWRVKAIDSIENESEWSSVGNFRVRTTGIEEEQQLIFDVLRLTLIVYPNPAKSFTDIRYTLPVESKISISLYEISGRLVRTLADEKKNPGIYQMSINTNEMASGVYFVSLKTDSSEQIIKRLVILK